MWLSKQEDLTTEAAWGVMRRFDTDEKINRRFFHELETYRKLYGKVEVNSKIVDIASKSFNEALKKEGSTEDDMLPAYMLIDKFLDEEMKQPTKMQFRLRFAEVKEDWRLYAKVVTQLLSKEKIKTNPGQANDYGWKLYLKCDDQVVLGEAVMWMSKAVRVKPDYAGMDTYAALLYKTGAYDEALVAAANAIELGLKEEQKVGETKELVDKIKAAQKGK
jgi:tetratricopeptide (TPR) repeat protein